MFFLQISDFLIAYTASEHYVSFVAFN